MYFLVLGSVLLSILYSVYVMWWLGKQPRGNEKMLEISQAIQDGSNAYLNRQYKAVGLVAAVLLLGIYLFLGLNSAFGFLAGSVASALAGYIGMGVAVRSNSRTAEAANRGLNPALSLA